MAAPRIRLCFILSRKDHDLRPFRFYCYQYSYWYSSKPQWGSRKTKQIWFAHLFWWSFHSSSKPHPGKSPNLSYVTTIITCNSQYLPEKMLGFHRVFKKRHPRVDLTSGCIWSLQFHLSIFIFPIKKQNHFGSTASWAWARMVAKYVYQGHPGIYLYKYLLDKRRKTSDLSIATVTPKKIPKQNSTQINLYKNPIYKRYLNIFR